MITMHGFFDLKEEQSETEFTHIYNDFAAHLIEQRMIISSWAMRRCPDPNYDSSPLETKSYISMDFIDILMNGLIIFYLYLCR